MPAEALLESGVDVAAGGEGGDSEAVGVAFDDGEGALTDGAGRAEDGEGL